MELGHYQLQIFVSLVVILGAAFVALICDFLKGNNEQLRELNIELKVRREEEQRRAKAVAARSKVVKPKTPVKEVAAIEEKIEKPATPRPMAAPSERKRTVSPAAIAAMERGAKLANEGRAPVAIPVAVEVPAQPVGPAVTAESPRVVLKPIPVASRPSVSIGKKDWNSLLNRNAGTTKAAGPVIDVTANPGPAEASFPAGFHDGFVLSQIVKTQKPVTGLVVSIGVNTMGADGAVPASVQELMQSLIGPDDFACQSSPEEFLLIYPRERGAAAQRRLSQIAERLWDFQLSSMGSLSILFSWGGVEVSSESIDEAIASANERMNGTRRSRKLVSMDTRQLRKAV